MKKAHNQKILTHSLNWFTIQFEERMVCALCENPIAQSFVQHRAYYVRSFEFAVALILMASCEVVLFALLKNSSKICGH